MGAESSAYVIITHLPDMKLNAISEDEMKMAYPKTYMYLMRIFLIEPKKSKNTIHHIHHLDF
jgi:hypothetical protein